MDPLDRLARSYRGRKVLVTGHTGFKGAWLSSWLLELEATVCGLALAPPSDPNLFDRLGLARRIDHRIGDVRDPAVVDETLEATRPDLIFHLAAEAIVRRSYVHPVETFSTNVLGTVHLLDAVRRAARPCVVIVVTSDKCYEHREPAVPHAEDDPLGGADPYSASKGCAEIASAAYRRSFFPPQKFASHGVALATVRAGNVIGGGDWAEDRLIPDIVRALSAARTVGLRNPEAVRPWQFVLDALSGYLWLGARMRQDGAEGLAEAWNFGPRDDAGVSVRALVERMLSTWQRGRFEDLSEDDAPAETGHLRLAIDKAAQRLGWRPTYGIDEAIDATVAWYRQAESTEEMTAFSAGQIREFARRAHDAGAIWTSEGAPA